MKTLLTILLLSTAFAQFSFAQRVNNGDPGLALTNPASIPKGMPMDTLLAAFEKGSPLSADFLNTFENGKSLAWVGMFFQSSSLTSGEYDYISSIMTCAVIELGNLLGDSAYCVLGHKGREMLLKKSIINTPFIGTMVSERDFYLKYNNMYFRRYQNYVIGVEYRGKAGNGCISYKVTDGMLKWSVPNKNNVCSIAYFFKKTTIEE